MILMIEPTQEFIKKVVDNHFDVSDMEIGLVKVVEFVLKFVHLMQLQ